MIKDLHPHFKWLMVFLLVITLALLLLPLPDKRKIQLAESAQRAPLPVYLLIFVSAGLLVAISLSTATALSLSMGKLGGLTVPWIGISLYLGLISSSLLHRNRSNSLSAAGWLLAILLCTGLNVFSLVKLSSLDLPYSAFIAMLTLSAYGTGLAGRRLWIQLQQMLQALLPELQDWASLTMANALIMGTLVSVWIMTHHGLVNLLKTAALLGLFGVLFVLWGRYGVKTDLQASPARDHSA